MNFEGAKENIQPLATGRNIERLEVALNAESHPEYQQELTQQRQRFEQSIANYEGDDPLDLWFEYVSWIEQSYPKSGKESTLDALLKSCLAKFEKDDRYTQDPRLIRLFIKYIDTVKGPQQYYQRMYNKGVGTMVADLYIAWAHYYDIADNFEQAEQVYQKGFDARATPVDQLKLAYERFHFSISQRVVKKDAYRQEFLTSMEEQRNAFTSLRSLKSSMVGSIRTGSAVRNSQPGRVRQIQSLASSNRNVGLNVYEGSSNANAASSQQNPSSSVIQEIQNSMLENTIEPGPWSKASTTKKGSVCRNKVGQDSKLSFAILEDSDTPTIPMKISSIPQDDGTFTKGIQLPTNFVRKNKPQKEFNVPPYIEETISPNVISAYDFIYLHPNNRQSFSIEELAAYKYFKKNDISNNLIKQQDKVWEIGADIPMRLPPTFVRKNQPQTEFNVERPDINTIPVTKEFACILKELYPNDCTDELSFEELKANKWQEQLFKDKMMDETICVKGRQSFGVQYTRRTIVPGGRKSIMPLMNDRLSRFSSNVNCVMEVDEEKDLQVEASQCNQTHRNVGELSVFRDEQAQPLMPFVVTKADEELKEKVQSPVPVTVMPLGNLSSDINSDMEIDEEMSPVKQLQNRAKMQYHIPPVVKPTVCNDQKPRSSITQTVSTTELKKSVHETAIPRWSIFKDIEPPSEPPSKQPNNIPSVPPIPPTMKDAGEFLELNQNQHVFAVPHKPAGDLTIFAEKRGLETVSIRDDVNTETLESKATSNDRSHYTIGSHTGAIKKTLRKSTITENAIQLNPRPVIVSERKTVSNDENAFKLPEPLDHERTMGQENADVDYSFCTQNFNVNLREQMVSTPFAPRRQEALIAPITNPETLQPPQPHKLSTIMETTEGSAHTPSTKSSLQFSSPEDDDPTKRSNCMNRTKYVATNVGSDNDSSGSSLNNSKLDEAQDKTKQIAQEVAETSQSFPFKIYEDPDQIGDTATKPQSTNPHLRLNFETEHCTNESTLPAIQFSVNLPSKLNDQTLSASSRGECVTEFAKDPIQINTENSRTHACPFPVFEDAHDTTPYQTKRKCDQLKAVTTETLLNFFATTPERPSKCPKTLTAQDFPVINNLSLKQSAVSHIPVVVRKENSESPDNRCEATRLDHHPRRIELSSICIKEEPQDSLVVTSPIELPSIYIEEDPQQFVIPKISEIQSLAQKENNKTIVSDSSEESCLLKPLRMDEAKGIECFKMSISFTEDELEPFTRKVPKSCVNEEPKPSATSSGIRDTVTSSENKVFDPSSTYNSAKVDDVIEIVDVCDDEDINCDQSIYFKQNSVFIEPMWKDQDPNALIDGDNNYEHIPVDLEDSRFIIESKLALSDIDPLDKELRQALLQEVDVISFLQTSDKCQLVKKVPSITVKSTINFNDKQFDVVKSIGQGAYGRVYCVKSRQDGSMYAVKKEIPANLWEYYICSEVSYRITNERILSGFMNIDYAIVGNNGSILFSEYSPYGTLLDVCNRVFSLSRQNIDESIVFILAIQMLDIIDHLHASDILHLDLKPDNFLVMRKLSTNYRDLFIQLIDFGNAVDLKRFPDGQKFNTVLETKNFVCVEMMEQRPWIYQPDLFCLAGTIHSVLFGRYMEVEKKNLGYDIKMKIKRYFNQFVWNVFFKKLININDCQSKPDLQEMKEMFIYAIDGDRNLNEKIKIFNTYIEN